MLLRREVTNTKRHHQQLSQLKLPPLGGKKTRGKHHHRKLLQRLLVAAPAVLYQSQGQKQSCQVALGVLRIKTTRRQIIRQLRLVDLDLDLAMVADAGMAIGSASASTRSFRNILTSTGRSLKMRRPGPNRRSTTICIQGALSSLNEKGHAWCQPAS